MQVQPAFRLGQARPAARPGVVAGCDPRRAGLAADRGVAVGDQEVHRHLVGAGVVEQVVEAPRRHRVDLHQAVALVPDHERRVGAGRGLVAAHAGEPHLVAAERVLQGRHLAAGAAQAGVAVVQLRAELGILLGDGLLRQHVDDPHVERARDLVARDPGLEEVVAGVEEEHVDAGQAAAATRWGSAASAIEQATAAASAPKCSATHATTSAGDASWSVRLPSSRLPCAARASSSSAERFVARRGASETVTGGPPLRRGAPTGRRSRRTRHPGPRGTG